MAVTGVAIGTGEVNALNAGNPVMASNNLVAQSTSVKLTSTGTIGESDITDPSYPLDAIYDDKLTIGARPSLSSFTTFWISGVLPADQTIDCCFVHLSNIVGTIGVRLDIADNDSFSGFDSAGPEITSRTTYTTSSSGSERFVWWGLESGGSSGYSWQATGGDQIRWRIRINSSSSIAPPLVTEVFLGKLRVFSRPFADENDLDDRPSSSEWREHVAANRDRTRYVTASGFADHVAVQDYSGQTNGDIGGLDDLSTLRSLQADSLYGSRAVWYRQQGQGPTYSMQLGSPMQGPVTRGMPFRRKTVFDFIEQPPFAEPEFTGTGVAAGTADLVIIFAYGQSNAEGVGGSTLVNTTVPAGTTVLRVNSGRTAYEDNVADVGSTYERPDIAMSHFVARQTGRTVIVSNQAVGDTAISGLAKGTTPYTELIADASFIQSQRSVESVKVYVYWNQGEKDRTDGTAEATYLAALNQLFSDLDSDLNTAFGEDVAMEMVIAQMCTPTAVDSGESTGTNTIAQAQLDAAIASGSRIHLCAPSYAQDFADGVHRNSTGHQQDGMQAGKVIVDRLNNVIWRNFYPDSIFVDAADTDTVVVDFGTNLPVSPVQINTSVFEASPPDNGFRS